jgi:hypothetical protein
MQNYCKTIGALAAASALVAGTASAEVEYEIHTGYTTEYIWRGIDLGDNLAEVGVDAATTYNDISLSAGVWATAFDAPGTADDIDSEVDFYAEAGYDAGFANLAVGYIYYWNMGSLGTDNQEIYFQASRDFGFATASLTYFWDVCSSGAAGNNNGYTELALSRGWELNQCVTLNVSSALGIMTEGWECSHWVTKATLDWGFAENAKLSPFVGFSLALGEDKGSPWDQTDNELFGGCMLAVGF